jgi:hypothetical protein
MSPAAVVAVVASLVASLGACGDEVAQRAAAQQVQAGRVGAASPHVPMRGFSDFPTWMPHRIPRYQLGNDDNDEFVPQPVALPDCPDGVAPHFDTPEAAMTYLASAWNRDDLTELCQVTNPNARLLLLDMHREALNLRLAHCDKVGVGEYTCLFDHDYPKRLHKKGVGHAILDVAAADVPGWFMTVYEGCG